MTDWIGVHMCVFVTASRKLYGEESRCGQSGRTHAIAVLSSAKLAVQGVASKVKVHVCCMLPRWLILCVCVCVAHRTLV